MTVQQALLKIRFIEFLRKKGLLEKYKEIANRHYGSDHIRNHLDKEEVSNWVLYMRWFIESYDWFMVWDTVNKEWLALLETINRPAKFSKSTCNTV